MSTNHYSSPETAQWWPQQHQQQQEPDTTMQPLRGQPISAIPIRTWHPDQLQPQPQPTWFNVGGGDQLQPQPQPQQQSQQQQPLFHDNNQQEQVGDDTKEHMFEKILTPSDVGRLNRLVIPKNHAEEHLPAGAEGYSSEHGKGLLLNFEDESGKCWKFRYSYWSSSQSYVLTKGWTRFVKEKHLEAGDIVVFQRHRMDHNHFFVSWRRRLPGAPPPGRPRRRRVEEAGTASGSGDHSHGNNNNNNNSSGYSHGNSENVGVGVEWRRREYYPALLPYPTQHQHLSYSPDFLPHAGGGSQGPNETTPVVKLFGVNLHTK